MKKTFKQFWTGDLGKSSEEEEEPKSKKTQKTENAFGSKVTQEEVCEWMEEMGVGFFQGMDRFFVYQQVMNRFGLDSEMAEKLAKEVVDSLIEHGVMKKHTTHETFDQGGQETDNYEDEGISETEMDVQNRKKSSLVQKPGESIHTAKWDKCVQEVKASSPDADPFAVCTAQLGDESFKSEYKHMAYTKSLVKKAKQKVAKEFGIGNAGPVPESLLARQDLEDGESEMEPEAAMSEIAGIIGAGFAGLKGKKQ